jgi:hypothetical protein
MEQHTFVNCQQLFHYERLLLLNDIWGECYETFYIHNLQIFVISKRFVPCKLFQPSLIFVSEARSPLHLGRVQLYTKRLGEAGKACQGQTL